MTRADLIIRNASIMTMDDAHPCAESLAVSGNKIIAVGSNHDVANLAGPATRIIDANGASVLPGFIESHLHIFAGAASLTRLDLSGVSGRDALRSIVANWSVRQPDGIIFANQAHYTILGEGPVTRQMLDDICPDRPFAMMAPDSHTAWANTAALAAAGILHGAQPHPGSEIVMAADGTASGELRETDAFSPVIALTENQGRESLGYTTARDPVPAATMAQRAADMTTLQQGIDYCAALGITSMHNMDGNLYQCELLQEIHDTGSLKCRIEVPFHYKNDKQLSDLQEAEYMRHTWNGDHLWCNRVKLFMDGVLDSGTAFVLDGYPDDPASTGDPLFSAEQFNEIAAQCDRRGFQIAVHAIGDAAVRRTLDGYQAAQNANGQRDSRHRIEHIEIIAEADIERFAELGVIASMQPLHALGTKAYPMEPTRSKIGDAKLARAFAWNTLRDAGAKLCFASDWPVSPVDPLKSIKAAMTREKLHPAHPDQRQSLHQAVHGYTAGGAYAEFSENRKGKLAEGFVPDIVILDANLEAADPAAIDRIKVTTTVCDGIVTYQA